MTYTALPDRRMPYHRDGTVVAYGTGQDGNAYTMAGTVGLGIAGYVGGTDAIELNDGDFVNTGVTLLNLAGSNTQDRTKPMWFFFPEQREVTAYVIGATAQGGSWAGDGTLEGSNDTTHGVDGTWEVASFPSGRAEVLNTPFDSWRAGIKAISFTGGKRAIRFAIHQHNGTSGGVAVQLIHVYGEKVAGQTPNDLIFIDHDTTPGVEFTAPEDFGDRPLGTTVTRQFRVKNASATLTATTINLQCNDADFSMSEDNATWVTTINIASLAAGAESATLYIRNTTPAAGNLLGPRFAEIVALVGSWT